MDRVIVRAARAIEHDGARYEAGEEIALPADAAEILLRTGAAEAAPLAAPEPDDAPQMGQVTEPEAGKDGPENEDPGPIQRQALITDATIRLLKDAPPDVLTRSGRLKPRVIEAHLKGLGHDIQVSPAERDAAHASAVPGEPVSGA